MRLNPDTLILSDRVLEKMKYSNKEVHTILANCERNFEYDA